MQKDPKKIHAIIDKVNGLLSVLNNDEKFDEYLEVLSDVKCNAIDDFISLRLNRVKDVYERCEDAFNRIGALDFSTQMEVENSNDVGTYLALTLNNLMEELSSRVFPFQLEVIDRISDLVIVTNNKGIIQKFNKSFVYHTGYTEKELLNKSISSIFTTTFLGVNTEDGFRDLEVNVIGTTGNIPVVLNVDEVKNLSDQIIGFTFIAQAKYE